MPLEYKNDWKLWKTDSKGKRLVPQEYLFFPFWLSIIYRQSYGARITWKLQ